MPLFNDKQMIDILQTRDRLEAYANHLGLYPALEEEPVKEEIKPVKVQYVYQHINSQTGELIYLRNKVKELLSLKERLESKNLSSGKRNISKYD